MILSKQKPWDEISSYLDGENSVFILGCNGCAQASGTGGPVQVEEMKSKLEEIGKKVTGSTVIDFLCEKALVKSRLRNKVEQLEAADSILVMKCGECLLEYTGGICPLTACTKGLINGQCGGASKGKCELDPEKDCGWELIYNRLKGLNQLDKLSRFITPKDYSKMMPDVKIMSTSLWALEHTD